MMQVIARFDFARDADGGFYSPERLVRWLEAKYARHGEEEDKHAADMLRWLSDSYNRRHRFVRGSAEGAMLEGVEPIDGAEAAEQDRKGTTA